MTIDDSSISSHYVDLDNLNIHYLSAGEGVPLALFGWPASVYLWRKVMGPLAKRRWVIAPDLAGFGRSDKPRLRALSARRPTGDAKRTPGGFFEYR